MKRIIVYPVLALIVVLFSITTSCSSNDCEYVTVIDPCGTTNILNLSTGIDESGNVIAPGTGITDPFWRLINRPLFNQNSVSTSDQILVNSLDGNAFVVNFNNANSTGWVNQNNSSAISPFNAGNTTQIFSANTVFSTQSGVATPYIYERSFCINNNANLIIDFKGRSVPYYCYFELINNFDNAVLSTSQIVDLTVTPWSDSVPVTPGSYSIRAYVSYRPGSGLPAFSLVGSVKIANDNLALSNNNNCCNNNIIGLTVISDDDCNNDFDSNVDSIFSNLINASIIDSSGTVVNIQDIDINGNIIFAGLPDGNYTVQLLIPTPGSTQSISPNNFQVTVANNEVKNFNIFVCP